MPTMDAKAHKSWSLRFGWLCHEGDQPWQKKILKIALSFGARIM
jgi:hypothetical protein